MEEVKLCKDCVYYKKKRTLFYVEHLCTHPTSISRRDYVDGRATDYYDCSRARGCFGDYCGHGAQHFERRK